MVRPINAPTTAVGESRYQFECDFVLGPAFQKMVDAAEAAGWDRLQIALSVINLCEEIIYGPESHQGRS